ncbi:hypothetical protein ACFX11_002641 [Malus domestica]
MPISFTSFLKLQCIQQLDRVAQTQTLQPLVIRSDAVAPSAATLPGKMSLSQALTPAILPPARWCTPAMTLL